jgi:glycerophosphoryl diester phosphodiesterase
MPRRDGERAPLVIAHRGASAYETENSLLAFRRALEMAADGIEFDVHATADGNLVVHHDPDVAGRRLDRLTLDQARRLRLPNGEPIPTLSEALALITPRATAFVELKTLPAEADDALFGAFDHAPRPDRCHVHSFDHRVIRRLTRSRPGLRAGVLSGSYDLDPAAEVRAAGAQVLWQHEERVDLPLAAQLHDEGFGLYVWTVDRRERMQRLIADGVDGICTNRPDVAREVVG